MESILEVGSENVEEGVKVVGTEDDANPTEDTESRVEVKVEEEVEEAKLFEIIAISLSSSLICKEDCGWVLLFVRQLFDEQLPA